MNTSLTYRFLTAVVAAMMLANTIWACPFCDPTQATLSEELSAADASVIAVLETPIKSASSGDTAPENDPFEEGDSGPYAGAKFKVVEVIRGDLKPGDIIEAIYFGEEAKDKQFLINGVQGDLLDWGSPLPLTPEAAAYVQLLPKLPADGPDRLLFFTGYLENPDPLLAQDAYDEFARAPYQDLIDIKDSLDRPQIVEWILDSQIGPTRRRLYLTMLGVCGTPEDVATLESLLEYNYDALQPGLATMINLMGVTGSAIGVPVVDELVRADVRSKQQCLDALIAAYLKLKGPDGLELVEERFLKNPNAEYTQLYSTIMALRFHGEESFEIPKERLVQSLRLLLDNDEIADQVIPDLTRWEDWEIMDRLVEKFKASDEDGWIRQPVVSYLLTAAEQGGEIGEKANAAVAELEQIDPEGVKRARSYLSWGLIPGAGSASAAKKESGGVAENESRAARAAAESKAQVSAETSAAPSTPSEQKLNNRATLAAPSRTTIIVVPVIVGLALMGVYSLMLRGGQSNPPRAQGN